MHQLIGAALAIFKLNGIMLDGTACDRTTINALNLCAGLSSAAPREAAGRQAETCSRALESAGRRGHVPVRKPLYRVLCRDQCRREPCPCAVSVSLWCLARVPHVSLSVLEFSPFVYIIIASLSHGLKRELQPFCFEIQLVTR